MGRGATPSPHQVTSTSRAGRGGFFPLLGLVGAVALCWALARSLHTRAWQARAEWPPHDDYLTLPSPRLADLFWLGYRQLGADITWIRLLIYSNTTGHDFRYLDRLIDTAIALDPKFRSVYSWAGYATTYRHGVATQAEFRTAVNFLEKGLAQFPNDYDFLWRLGEHYFLNLRAEDPAQRRRERQRGAALLERAMRHPDADDAAPRQAAVMLTSLGRSEAALRNLHEMYLTAEGSKRRANIRQAIERLEKDPSRLAALQDAKDEFDRAWQAAMPYAPASLFVILGPPPDSVIDLEKLAISPSSFAVAADLADRESAALE